MSDLWKECLVCNEKCCSCEIVFPLFVTSEEFERMERSYPNEMELFNKSDSCPLLKNQLCLAHEIKPTDCRLFPFDMIRIDGKFFWIIREINCKIVQNEENFELYLSEFEQKIIPDFIQYMEEYALFRFDELAEKLGGRIIREVKCGALSLTK